MINYGGHFDFDNKNNRLRSLNDIINGDGFWNREDKDEILKEYNSIKYPLDSIAALKDKVTNNIDMINMLKLENDEDVKKLLIEDIDIIKNKLEELENVLLLSGPYDDCDLILDIHPGAGGTESCDWALMLYRMYTRYALAHNYKVEVIDYQDGDEAGIKSVSMIIRGAYAYGYLKYEKGVHRLIRISPFDSNSRRHTSFASVDITPIYNQSDVNIEIKDSDIRIDIFRSSGNGGQGVNTTDSAVRITHIPTKIVVTCQNERSQIRNKEIAMTVLKNKLYDLELKKRKEELHDIKGDNDAINFGSQIRTYTMHPYSLVKDHRTNTETGNVTKVLDGDIDMFINDNLRLNIK